MLVNSIQFKKRNSKQKSIMSNNAPSKSKSKNKGKRNHVNNVFGYHKFVSEHGYTYYGFDLASSLNT